jgi:hypothetical protein
MFSWGVTLMVVGGLSFVLPIFGRQFIVVSALGLTGMGSAVAGIILFVIGILLFNAAKKKELQEHPALRTTNYDIHQTMPTSSGKANGSINKASPPLTESRAPCFKMGSGEHLDPYSFGVFAVKTGIEDSQQAVDEMIGTGELPGQQSIRSNKGAVQLHLLALIVGVLYVCASKLSSSNKQVLTEVGSGLSDGFTALFSDESGKLSNPNNPRTLYGLFEDYAGSLANELNNIGSETLGSNPFDMGATARLVVENIGGQCDIQAILTGSPLERIVLEQIASSYGVSLLIRLQLEKQICYSL